MRESAKAKNGRLWTNSSMPSKSFLSMMRSHVEVASTGGTSDRVMGSVWRMLSSPHPQSRGRRDSSLSMTATSPCCLMCGFPTEKSHDRNHRQHPHHLPPGSRLRPLEDPPHPPRR